jgi:1-aminocyclopropane-1-carboxylate deaminase/D-cysteine desulfhydrase-like pyridoxal-dependent ACC family enzyme
MQIGAIDRLRLGTFPTPLQELRNLRSAIGGPRLFIKRDDMTGLGLGGNKLRKLEYAMAEAQSPGATTVVTVGVPGLFAEEKSSDLATALGVDT